MIKLRIPRCGDCAGRFGGPEVIVNSSYTRDRGVKSPRRKQYDDRAEMGVMHFEDGEWGC